MFQSADSAVKKLYQRIGDEPLSRAVDIALELLPYRNDEQVAVQILFAILLNDNLAEALDGRL